jgi:hypothetical protein
MPNIVSQPHVYNWRKVSDCALPEGRISIPFTVMLFNPNTNPTPISTPGLNLIGDSFVLDTTSLSTTIPLSGIKSLELDIVLSPSTEGTMELPVLLIFVQDSQQFITLASNTDTKNGTLRRFHATIPIISNAGTKIIFVLAGSSTDNSNVNIIGSAHNFEMSPQMISF